MSVNAVGVVPHDEKIRSGGRQRRHAADGLFGINNSVGIGVLGYAPDAFDGRVFHGFFHGVHVGPAGGHGDCNQLKAEGFRDFEVPVVAGSRAEPFDGFFPAPGLWAVEKTVGIGLADGVIHQLQAGVAAHEDLLRPASQYFGEEPPGGGNAGHFAVIPDVDAVGDVVFRLLHQPENIADQIKLLLAGLAPGHIKAEALSLQSGEFCLQARVFLFSFRLRKLGIRLHE